MLGDQLADAGEVQARVVVAVDHLDDLQGGVVLAQHGAKADLALLVAAIELAAPHHGKLASPLQKRPIRKPLVRPAARLSMPM